MKENRLDKLIDDVVEQTNKNTEEITSDTYIGVVVEVIHPNFKYGVIVNEDYSLERPYLVNMYETLSMAIENKDLITANDNEEWFKKEEINMFCFI